MKHIEIDFESYYDDDISVSVQGLKNYVRDSYAYLVSVTTEEFEFCGTPEEMPKVLGDSWFKDPGIQLWAANSNFDQAWFEKYFCRAANPWKCLLDRAAYSQFPRDVANVSRVLLKTRVDKTIRDEMKSVHYKDLPEARQQEVSDYCLNDATTERKMRLMLPEMSPVEDAVAAHTRMCNRRGVHIDVAKVERDKTYLERIHFDAHKLIPWTKDGSAPLSYTAFADYCAARGSKPPHSLDKRDASCNAWIKENPELAKVLGAMRTYRGSNTKLEKLKTLQGTICDGVMPLELLYCGARHTRRWSSRGFNVQNLDKESSFVDIMEKWPEFAGQDKDDIGIFMREYLIPPPGCTFGLIDFSQIEPRCLNWIVGNESMLAAMHAGFEIYEAHAMAFHNWRGNPGTLKATNKKLRDVCKVENLGLGYGMGAEKFAVKAAEVGMDLTPAQAKTMVDAFRAGNPKVTAFWKYWDAKVKAAVRGGDHTLEIEMPSGDFLRHFNVRAKAERKYESFSIRGDFSQMSIINNLWGGPLTENVTQRMARDVMAESILKLEAAGFPVIFHAHDEVILALPIAGAEAALKEAEQIMSVPPAWAEGLPLGVEGFLSPHYTK